MLEIDVQGALAVKQSVPEALLVFVQAPSRDEQRRRLEGRARVTGEAEASIEARLARADDEERIGATQFDAVVVTDDVERATTEVAAILALRRNSPEGA